MLLFLTCTMKTSKTCVSTYILGKLKKENEYNRCVSFSQLEGVQGTSLGFLGQKFVVSSDMGSVRSGRLEIRTYDPKSDFAAFAYN